MIVKQFPLALWLIVLLFPTLIYAETDLERLKEQYNQALSRLEQSDRSSVEIRKAITEIKKKEQVSLTKMANSKNLLNKLKKDIAKHKTSLKKQLRYIQRLGRDSTLFSLGSTDAYVQEYNRRVRYKQYFDILRSMHLSNLKAIDALTEQQKTVQQAHQREHRIFQQRHRELLKQQDILLLEQAKSRVLVEQIKQSLNKNQQLAVYAQKRRVEKLNRATEKAVSLSSANKNLSKNQPLSTLKKQLPWPSSGSPVKLKHFDNAWLISQNTHNIVRSIVNGIVISIQWLPALGNTIIIDHGHNYRGVYAQMTSNYVNVGDRVQAGSTIGLSGEDTQREENGLIFILLRNAKQLNLKQWMKTS